MLASGAIGREDLGANASLLDVPATVIDAFGLPLPDGWAGRSLLRQAVPAMEAAA
jgi:arylsulfatase A-like enzyme